VKPEQLIKLYEFEACPFCRRTREAITDLDIDVLVYPCPKVSLPESF
jgi:anaphase-promoting complex subunit 7